MADTISLPVSDFKPTEIYFLLRDSIVPRPIAWVSTVDTDGNANLAPFSFFNVCCPSPPVLGFSCGPRGDDHGVAVRVPKDTYTNIRNTREFVINIVPERLMTQMMESSTDYPPGTSEFAATGLAEAPCVKVKAPRVLGAPVAYECTLHDVLELGANSWIMGDVVHVHIDKSVYQGTKGQERHRIDPMEDIGTRPVGRLGRANYVRIREIETHLRKDGPNR